MTYGSHCAGSLTERQTPTNMAWLTWVFVLSPVLLLITFLTLALHVRLGLGHWPKPMIEGYSTFAYSLHEYVFMLSAFFTVYAAIPIWLILLFFRLFRISLRIHLFQAGVYALGWILIAIYTTWDPGRFTAWFLD